ncbi:hypothetical protein CYMTET_5242 [Cymbomonas tetramitiformis]|uniref:Uncharacterized protein n=1 Tax=Cymbomonas tetramitiformis TaxID=36881 RepID=A0AAE0LJK1_9CHLO|nr:hypothetical protein CYMTET_5242 [Cymbomonas tetramitiformis]
MRRNTNVVYFTKQVQSLLVIARTFATLTAPSPLFLAALEAIQHVREYAEVTRVSKSGKPFDVDNLEVAFVAAVLTDLHGDYMYVRSKFASGEVPEIPELQDEVCMYYDNVLRHRSAATHYFNGLDMAGAIADDRRKQLQSKRKQLVGKVPCPTCHKLGHTSDSCWVTNKQKREELFKRCKPEVKAEVLRRVFEYEKHGKLPIPGQRLGAVADQSDLHPGLEESGEVLFALRECSPSVVSDFSGVYLHQLPLVGGTKSWKSRSTLSPPPPLSNHYAVLEGVDCEKDFLCSGGQSTLAAAARPVDCVSEARVMWTRAIQAVVTLGATSRCPCWEPSSGIIVPDSGVGCYSNGAGSGVSEACVMWTRAIQAVVTICATSRCPCWEPSSGIVVPDSGVECYSNGGGSATRKPKKHHCYVPNKHRFLLNRHRPFKVSPVHASFTYIDTICAFFPDRARLDSTQSAWEVGREQHLGPNYQIYPRQPWYTKALQWQRTMLVSGFVDVLTRAKYIIDLNFGLPGDRTDSLKELASRLQSVRGAVECLEAHLRDEPLMVRTSYGELKDWVSNLGALTQALVQSVDSHAELISAILGYDSDEDDDDVSDTEMGLEDYDDSDDDVDSSSEGGSTADRVETFPVGDAASWLHYPVDQHLFACSDSMLPVMGGSLSEGDAGGMCDAGRVSGIYSAGSYCGSLPDLESSSDSDDGDYEDYDSPLPDLESSSDSDSEGDDGSLPDLESASDTESDSDSDVWICHEDGSLSPFYPGDHPGSRPGGDQQHSDMACGLRTGDSGLSPSGGKSAVLDSGATRHIFSSVDVFDEGFDAATCQTFAVVQCRSVDSVGSGTVTFTKLDVHTGQLIGLQLLGAHCIPGQPFNLVSVVALEDAGFLADFGARQISKGGHVFCFARIGNQYIISEDLTGTVDTFLACAIDHDDDSVRDKTDWKFEDTTSHFETHGPSSLELFASENNHILEEYCTLLDTCFVKDWAGKHCYGNPPFEHDIILRCLQKALSDFERDPAHTKFMFVLRKWVTASWWDLTKHFSIIYEYPPGQKIFSAPLATCYNTENLELCGEDRVWIEDTKWAVVILYKDGHTVQPIDPKMLQHIRLGHISDQPMDHMVSQSVPMGITVSQYARSTAALLCAVYCLQTN